MKTGAHAPDALRAARRQRGWHVDDASIAIAAGLVDFARTHLDEPLQTSAEPGPADPPAPTAPVAIGHDLDVPATLAGITDAYASGDLSPTECVLEFLRRTARAANELNAVASIVTEHVARQAAHTAERNLRTGRARPLEGVPFAVKDVIHAAGLPTRYGSTVWAEPVDQLQHSSAVARLANAGAIPIAKAATTEFAFGSLIRGAFTTVVNPRDSTRITGGSSTGAAALVSSDAIPFALATDAAGSSRSPASYCGVVGYKPTTGAIPMRDAATASPLLEGGGLLARNPDDVRAVMEDALHVRPTGDDGAPLTIGVPDGWQSYADGPVVEAIESWLARVAPRCLVRPVPWRLFSAAYRTGWRLLLADAADCYGSLLQRPGVDPVLAARIVAGSALTPEDIREARDRRQLLIEEATAMFDAGLDMLVTPTVGNLAPTLASLSTSLTTEQDRIRASTVFTIIANVVGSPALSIPILPPRDLPVGVQLIGAPGQDDRLLAHAAELAVGEF